MVIPHSRPTLDSEDYESVLRVLQSGHLVQGEQVARFEEALSSFVGVRHAVAVSSGTAALHLSLIALGVSDGDEVIIPSYVCSALLNAVMYVRAIPVIADIDGRTFNMDGEDIGKRLSKKTKAIIVPHMFGLPADINKILSFGIPVIEDCAQSISAAFRERCTGSFGVCSVFSFYTTKLLAAGEGGMVVSDDERLAETVRDLRDYDEKETYSVRYNYKMTDMQAALGMNQMKKLSFFIQKRQEIADYYTETLQDAPVSLPVVPEGRDHIFYRYVLLTRDRDELIEKMRREHIDCRQPVFHPLHDYLSLPGYPVTDEVAKRAVSIPIYPSLKDEDVKKVAHSMRTLLMKG
jgi:perosamine synthetase